MCVCILCVNPWLCRCYVHFALGERERCRDSAMWNESHSAKNEQKLELQRVPKTRRQPRRREKMSSYRLLRLPKYVDDDIIYAKRLGRLSRVHCLAQSYVKDGQCDEWAPFNAPMCLSGGDCSGCSSNGGVRMQNSRHLLLSEIS